MPFNSRHLNNKVNNVNKKTFRTVYSAYKSKFQELLGKDAFLSVHHRNIQTSVIQINKYIHGSSAGIMEEIFKINTTLP